MASNFTLTYSLVLFVDQSKEDNANVAANTKTIIKADLRKKVREISASLGNSFSEFVSLLETET